MDNASDDQDDSSPRHGYDTRSKSGQKYRGSVSPTQQTWKSASPRQLNVEGAHLSTSQQSLDRLEREGSTPPHEHNEKVSRNLTDSKKVITDLRQAQLQKQVHPGSKTSNMRDFWALYIILAVIFVMAGVAVCFVYPSYAPNSSKSSKMQIPDDQKPLEFKKKVINIKNAFKNQSIDTFIYLEQGVSSLPSVLMLIYNDGKAEAECIASHIKTYFNEIYQREEMPVEIRAADIHEEEKLQFMDDFKDKLERSRFMLIYDLDKVKGEVAENFYSLCDLENPLVPDAVVVFTLNVGNDPNYKLKRPSKKAWMFLDRMWRDVETHTREPLITRLTSLVVEVNKEDYFTCDK